MHGVVAAGHPLTARAGADVLRAGGNAVDAAVAAVLMSFVAESPLTGPGAGGFMLVHARGESHLLDFFVAAPGRGLDAPDPADLAADRRELQPRRDPALQRRAVVVRGVRHDARRRAARSSASEAFRSRTWPRPAARAAREGVEVVPMQAFLFRILEPILRSTPESGELYAPGGRLLERGRHDPAAGARGPARAPRRGGPRLPLLGRRGRGRLGLGARARRPAHPRGPRRLRGDRAPAGGRDLPRARGAHQPAAVVGRDPDRGRARHPRAARAAARRVACSPR